MSVLVQASPGRWGLGNMLFPWARAEVFSDRFGATMIAPQWTQLKIGPMLRRETDLRYYTNLFDNNCYVRGLRRWAALWRRERVAGEEAERIIADGGADQLDGKIVEFRSYKGWFRDDLPRHRALVRRRLDAITSRSVKREIEAFEAPTEIVAHIRRGDMRVLKPGEEFAGRSAYAESEAYFISVIEQIRSIIGERPVTVFSNSSPGELTEIPAIPGVHFVPTQHSALTDMWLMSRAKVLIASSLSSFSAWASYLGGMPTIWHRPYRLPLVPERPELAIEIGPDCEIQDAGRVVIADAAS